MDDIRIIRIRAREKLHETGLSMSEFAVRHNISQGSVYEFFANERPVGLLRAGMIAEALGVSLDWLCGIQLPDDRRYGS